MSSTVSTETSMLSTIIIEGFFIDLEITWSMAGSQATPVRPLPGLPVGEIEVPNVTNGEDLVTVFIVIIGNCEGTNANVILMRKPGPADGFWSTTSTTLSG